jgi:two-component system cell cycle response regulator CpdR
VDADLTATGKSSVRAKAVARILVVDDEPGIRFVVTAALTRAGYAVRSVSNAKLAIASCESEEFDLLLSDVVMPGMNGHALAQWVATNHPMTRTALMTGADAVCLKCPYSPRCEIIPKPFMPKELVAFVGRALSS